MCCFGLPRKHKPYTNTTLRIRLGLAASSCAPVPGIFENVAPFMRGIMTDLDLLLHYGEPQDGGKKQGEGQGEPLCRWDIFSRGIDCGQYLLHA